LAIIDIRTFYFLENGTNGMTLWGTLGLRWICLVCLGQIELVVRVEPFSLEYGVPKI
jgi:hypothetical protein